MSNSITEIFENLERSAGDALENIADLFRGKAETLRDETTFHPVSLPRDLAAHAGAQTEWWYYTGHASTPEGGEFGFELVFFKRRTDLDKFSMVPLRLFGNPIFFAHFAITDRTDKSFRYAHRKSANSLFDLPASASETHFHLRLGDWSVREAGSTHVLRATIGDDLTFEATLNPVKGPVLNGRNNDGVSYKDEGEASRYFSYTRMEMEGDLTRAGRASHFTGSAWMDREFGTWTPTENQKGWDWFSIQLENNCELMCYQLRNGEGGVSEFSSGTFVDSAGNYTYLSNTDFSIEPTSFWTSPGSKAVYPSGWKVSVPKFDLQLEVAPVIEDQELDTRGTTMIVYWEGASDVSGMASGKDIKGRAYVELVGYDRSHDQPNLAHFLIGNTFESVTKWIFG